MKKNVLFFVLLGFFLVSCSSSDDSDEPQPESVTYQANIKSIIQNHCLSCHGNPVANGAPMSLTTYAEVVDAVNTRFLIDRINDTANPMPEAGLLPSSTRQLIETWVSQGMKEN